MREIKFRGKDLYTGEWEFGDLETCPTDDFCIIHRYKEDGTYNLQAKVVKNTVGEFTGLYDYNENEIYEGDVVKFGMDKEHLGIVEHDRVNPCFCITYKTIYGTIDWEYDFVKAGKMRIEVIGNIHDNFDLIK